jgi:hypothetical protein
MRGVLRLVFLPLLLSGLVACDTQPTLENEASSEFGAAQLYPVSGSGFAHAWASRDADLSSYRKLDIVPLDVSAIEVPQTTVVAGTLKRDWLMTPEKEKEFQRIWAQAMAQAFKGYSVASEGDGVLRITAKLVKIAPGRPTATTVGGALQPVGSSQDVVEIWMEFRFYDVANDRLLAVVRDNRTMASVSMSRTAPVGLDLLFKSWAALLHTRVSGK